ncbi:MAG: integrase arm-type DNA-binding domain-containing protein [Phyllobacterium sp.]|uniref:tyrosine-type recombinase/integrase n=1 Tax=Phyllobacterium sp. TaxID=1871046 RepID=UPI0030F24A60
MGKTGYQTTIWCVYLRERNEIKNMRPRYKLTATQVAKTKFQPNTKVSDGGGLYLNISKGGSKSWIVLLTRDGVRKEIGIGPVADVTLEEARTKCDELRKVATGGECPLQFKRARQNDLTVKQACEQFMALHEKDWKRATVKQRWQQIIDQHLGDLSGKSVRKVTRNDVAAVLQMLWREKHSTARFLQSMLYRTLNWCSATGRRDENAANPADWSRLKHTLPKKKVGGNFASMPYEDVPAFVARLRKKRVLSARLLEVIVLTCVRKNEAMGMTWSEVDLDKGLWTIPAVRMKGNAEHTVWLCPRVIEILTAIRAAAPLRREIATGRPTNDVIPTALVFLSSQTGKQYAPKTMNILVPEFTVHGFRSSARTYLSNETDVPFETCEEILSHKVGDAVSQAYRRGVAFKKMQVAWGKWAAYVG